MSKYRNELPQLAGGLFLNDAGLETDADSLNFSQMIFTENPCNRSGYRRCS